jgi:hypothetical protein
MWCANCQADVAAEVTPNTRRVRCATCGSDIRTSSSSDASPTTLEARELLQRWSSHPVFDPYGPIVGNRLTPQESDSRIPEAVSSTPGKEQRDQPLPQQSPLREPQANPESSKPVFRIDRPHIPESGSDVAPEPAPATKEPEPITERPVVAMHEAHASLPSPHFDVQQAVQANPPRKVYWGSLFGQLMAYGGVGLLTIGTSLVVWGFFGGPDNYTPTGWLIATIGQMLLFLGVVTLISGGMEQTTDEVARRIDSLGDKLLRIEQASRHNPLRGPKIPAERYAGVSQHSEPQQRAHEAADR